MTIVEMEFCLICKEKATGRYQINAKDVDHDNHVDGYICKSCWLSFVSSFNNERPFKIMKIKPWLKGIKDDRVVS